MAELTKRGVLTALVCSDSFMRLGTTQRKVFGVPNLPLLEIKHPLGGLAIEQVEERAEAAIPQLIAFLKEQRS
jgi:hypothetical protein